MVKNNSTKAKNSNKENIKTTEASGDIRPVLADKNMNEHQPLLKNKIVNKTRSPTAGDATDQQPQKLSRTLKSTEPKTFINKLADDYRQIIPRKHGNIPTPRNIAELANLKALNMPHTMQTPSRYDNLILEKNKNVYEPLTQPLDFNNPNEDHSFPPMKLPLAKLIDPANWQTLGVDLYPAEMFEHLTKAMVSIEKKKALVPAFTKMETTFVYAVLNRLLTAFKIMANLNQIMVPLVPQSEFENPAELQSFKEACIYASNAITQEFLSLAPIITTESKKKLNKGQKNTYDEKVRKLHYDRLREAPTIVPKAYEEQALCPTSNIFEHKERTLQEIKELSIKDYRYKIQSYTSKFNSNRGKKRKFHFNQSRNKKPKVEVKKSDTNNQTKWDNNNYHKVKPETPTKPP